MSNNLNDLEMAKKRDHKILITDEAINKVPRIKYRDIPENEYDNLWDLAKNVLKIAKEENNSNEVAITYSLESAKLIEKGERYIGIALGNEHDVDPLSDTTVYHLVSSAEACKAITLFNEAVDKNNAAEKLKDFQNAADYFLRNSYHAGIVYDNR